MSLFPEKYRHDILSNYCIAATRHKPCYAFTEFKRKFVQFRHATGG